MKNRKDLEKLSDFVKFISEVTKPLSRESVNKIFAVETLQAASECKSTQEFLQMIDSLKLPELKDKEFMKDFRMDYGLSFDKFLKTGEIPPENDLERIIKILKQPASRGRSLYDDVVDGATAGVIVGAGIGAFAGGLVTSPAGGVGSSVGAMAGAIAGAVGGAIGGVINWALGE